MSLNKFPWVNMHGFNLDWVIETIKSYTSKVDELAQEIADISNTYETKENITTNRKLSVSGNFTGTWFNESYTSIKTNIASALTLAQTMIDAINARESIGLIYDGKTFPYIPDDEAINITIDGGAF